MGFVISNPRRRGEKSLSVVRFGQRFLVSREASLGMTSIVC